MSNNRRRLMLRQAAGGFDPLSATYGSPALRYWAEDPDWTDPGDGNPVSSWRNDGSAASSNLTQASAGLQPTFVSSGINGRPSISFDGSDHLNNASSATYSQPTTIVVVLELNNAATTQVVSSATASGSRHQLFNSSGTWNLFAGSVASTGISATADPTVTVSVFSGASSLFRSNGTPSGTLSVGANTLGVVRVGEDHIGTSGLVGSVAFYALYNSDITGEAWFSEFESGLRTMYGA